MPLRGLSAERLFCCCVRAVCRICPQLCRALLLRAVFATTIDAPAKISDGNQTHNISFQSTCKPRAEKKPAPIGETAIGLTGKKYRVLLNGAKNATPSPPSVK